MEQAMVVIIMFRVIVG